MLCVPNSTQKRKVSTTVPKTQIKTALRRRRRADFARALESPALRRIDLGPPSSEPSQEQVMHDLQREPALLLNGVLYGYRHGRSLEDFLEKLERLCDGIIIVTAPTSPGRCATTAKKRKDASTEVNKALLTRMARTTAGADAYKTLTKLLGLDDDDADYIVMPRHAIGFRRAAVDAPRVEIRRHPGGGLRARILFFNAFALHRFCDGHDGDELDPRVLKDRLPDEERPSSLRPSSLRPSSTSSVKRHPEWMPIDTLITDELILNDGIIQGPRFLSVSVPSRWSRLVAF